MDEIKKKWEDLKKDATKNKTFVEWLIQESDEVPAEKKHTFTDKETAKDIAFARNIIKHCGNYFHPDKHKGVSAAREKFYRDVTLFINSKLINPLKGL